MGIRWVRAAYMGKIIVWLTTSVLSLFDPKSPGAREKTDAIGGEFTERETRALSAFSINRTKPSEKLGHCR
jgi:hypothetical protein